MNRRKIKKLRTFLLLMVAIFLISLKSIPKTASLDCEWNLILVNHEYRIPANYEIELKEISNGKMVDTRIYDSLFHMIDEAKDEGFHMEIVEAYRSKADQQDLMNQKVESYIRQGYPKFLAKKAAKSWVAVPGTSEHQLGIAVDINPDYDKSGREVYDWLAKNAYKYGFINRYPANKVHITKIHNEPWHYRYVGEKSAREIYEKNLCLEEYLKK